MKLLNYACAYAALGHRPVVRTRDFDSRNLGSNPSVPAPHRFFCYCGVVSACKGAARRVLMDRVYIILFQYVFTSDCVLMDVVYMHSEI